MRASVAHVYSYAHSSSFETGYSGPELRLATSSRGKRPYFFHGGLRQPKRSADLLSTLMKVVRSRYHVPPAMLERILREADPVVTAGGDRLRFEGFSPCASVHARVDFLPDALEGKIVANGTTNVDFNAPMLAALSRLRHSSKVTLSVGSDEVKLETADRAVIEKKVDLPLRWLRSFVELQAHQVRMEPRFDVSGSELRRFLRSLPRGRIGGPPHWIVKSGRGLRLSRIASHEGVRIVAIERLRPLELLASFAESVSVRADPIRGGSGWVLDFGCARLEVTLSPEVWRGFSGEGQVLSILASDDWKQALPQVHASLRWESCIGTAQLATKIGIDENLASRTLAVLGVRGLVGFELRDSHYFHRELPFDLSLIEALHPRLVAARVLAEQGRVQPTSQRDGRREYFVASGNSEHYVRLSEGAEKCSCPWYGKHQGERGPCKHVLAAQIYEST